MKCKRKVHNSLLARSGITFYRVSWYQGAQVGSYRCLRTSMEWGADSLPMLGAAGCKELQAPASHTYWVYKPVKLYKIKPTRVRILKPKLSFKKLYIPGAIEYEV